MSRARLRAAVVAVGDELIEGRFADTNSATIARALGRLGIGTERFVVLGDDEEGLAAALAELARAHAVVVVSGGLGPTLDDVTRAAAARAAGLSLVRTEVVLEGLRALYRARGQEMPASNVRQADFPAGAEILANPAGTAPGFAMRLGEAELFALPGPPREMEPMLAAEVLPRLERRFGHADGRAEAQFHLVGLAESRFADLAGDWMARGARPEMGVLAKHGVLSVRLASSAPEPGRAREVLLARERAFRERFERWIFSEGDPSLGKAAGGRLLARDLTVALAESCTGGLAAALLTECPGISRVFREGFVTYSEEAKARSLGVSAELLARHGAVSAQCAGAMAAGAAERTGARIALSVTGVAGPAGDGGGLPVGLVYFGLFDGRRGADPLRRGALEIEERRFPAVGRDAVRRFAAHTALELLWRAAGAAD